MTGMWVVWAGVITVQGIMTRMGCRELGKQISELRRRINALDRHTHHGLYADRGKQ